MVLRPGTKTGSNRDEKRNTRLLKLKSHLPFLCACFKGHDKQRRDMITAANRGQIESISEIALNLLKGNILIPKSSFERLREAARIFQESKISNEKSNFFLFYQNISFCELVSKKIF